MSTYPTGPVLTQALVHGPEMLVFYVVLITWFVIFARHVTRPESRPVTSKIGLSLSLLMGILAPLKFFVGVLRLNSPFYLTGSVDPVQHMFSFDLITLSALVIGSTAAVTLIMSAWAWLLPGPVPREEY